MKVSIITTTYNSGKTLRDTIKSVLAQTYTDIEHIIIDGLSSDNTLEIIKEFEPLYEGRLKYVSEKDKGLYDAMNKGIAMATGDIIGILNSDDFFTNNEIVNIIARTFYEESVDAVYGDIHFVNDSNLLKSVRYYSSQSFRPWKMRFGFMPAHPTFYCKRIVYNKYGTFDTEFKIGADFENLLRLIYINKIRTCYVPMDFVTMRTGGASTSGLKSHNQITRDIVKALLKNGINTNFALVSLRYPVKIAELIYRKLKR